MVASIQPQTALSPTPDPFAAFHQCIATAEAYWVQLFNLPLPRFFGVAKGREQLLPVYQPLADALAQGLLWPDHCRALAAQLLAQGNAEVERRRAANMKDARERFQQKMAEIKSRQDWVMQQTHQELQYNQQQIKATHQQAKNALDSQYRIRTGMHQQQRDATLQTLKADHKRRIDAERAKHQTEYEQMSARWQQGLMQALTEINRIHQSLDRCFPVWDSPVWKNFQPPTVPPPALQFGQFDVDISQFPGGAPRDPKLNQVKLPPFSLPALAPFEQSSLLLVAADEGRDKAVETLQGVMLRLLSAIPPAKARFTIVDPVGLGQNFSAFMHLADYDEQLITNRIWTESIHIEHRLADLTEQMEIIIQKYLRNEFASIADYNAQAGEVAEPFRFLVVANFPANFTETSARRLVSIATTGAKCGVFTLVSVDRKLTLPPGFQLKDLERHATRLTWREGQFHWKNDDFAEYPLRLETPPEPEFCTKLMRKLGELAREAGKVEVPFETIAPAEASWWSTSSAKGLRVPLGPAGANKLQYMDLGKGTSQHVLIAGKTGSGKSTLLHTLITNIALHYGPEEVELYLVDFKKGVEFKTYAQHELPHARVVAIESEREFGLSVLQRLDAELKSRGDRFRDLGVQDLASFRRATGDAPLPRILLIVDEFQEWFVEDDKLSQEVSLLLDRLVRQGRAFGIHVMLGSQTLGGAYSLARSTVGQMAVRIALQCSESDAHLILSEDNAAARLLSRPGEAIYNDANGLMEGNHPFQVAWLGEDRHSDFLNRIQQLYQQRRPALKPRIIFEGNVPADVQKNHQLAQVLAVEDPPPPTATYAWLGEAVAIKDPTAAVFRRQSGSHLLMIGQQDQPALSILTIAMIGLSAQHPVNNGLGAKFYVFDGSPSDSPHAGTLSGLSEKLPHPVISAPLRETPRLIAEISEELTRRQALSDSNYGSIYLIIYDLSRFRDLRRKEDDYGFTRPDAPPDPARQLVNLLREGPNFGIHCLIWCDTLNNLNRTFDRPALREFEMRVLFQMSPGDSSNLIDTPAASKLGLHRAYLHQEEEGRLEKFRPYGPPSPTFLSSLRPRTPVSPPPGG